MILQLGMQHLVLQNYLILSNDDPILTFDLLAERFNLLPYVFISENDCLEDFSETSKDQGIILGMLFGKELFILFAASAFRKLSSIYVFKYFPFGF